MFMPGMEGWSGIGDCPEGIAIPGMDGCFSDGWAEGIVMPGIEEWSCAPEAGLFMPGMAE